MIATPKAVYLRPFLEMRLVAELLTVPKRVMVFLVFLLLPGYSGHTSRPEIWGIHPCGVAAQGGNAGDCAAVAGLRRDHLPQPGAAAR